MLQWATGPPHWWCVFLKPEIDAKLSGSSADKMRKGTKSQDWTMGQCQARLGKRRTTRLLPFRLKSNGKWRLRQTKNVLSSPSRRTLFMGRRFHVRYFQWPSTCGVRSSTCLQGNLPPLGRGPGDVWLLPRYLPLLPQKTSPRATVRKFLWIM